jgi:hypothetical protein
MRLARKWKVGLMLGGLALSSCNISSSALISLPVAMGGAARDAGTPLTFTTPLGWQVQLDHAVLSVGPFYFVNQPEQGTVTVQVLSQQFVEAVDPTLYLTDAGASGQTGPVEAVQIDLFPPGCSGSGVGSTGHSNVCTVVSPSGPSALALYQSLIPGAYLVDEALVRGSVAFASGTAQQPGDGGVAVPFYGFMTIDTSTGGNPSQPSANTLLDLEQISAAAVCPDNKSCPPLTFTSSPSVLEIRVDPSHWFDGVDFASGLGQSPVTCPDVDAGGPGCALTWNDGVPGADSATNTQLVARLRNQAGGFFFQLAPAGGP